MATIVLAGTIGAGKSSLTALTASRLGSEAFYKSVDDNKVLPLSYVEPEKYALLLQIYFLNKRLNGVKQALTHENNVLNCLIYEDPLLFHLNVDLGRANETEVKVHDDLLQNILRELPHAVHKERPDLLVHIRISFPKMLECIRKCGRPYEQTGTGPTLHDYYQMLNERYDQWYESYNESPRIQIDNDKYDFIEDPETC